MQIYIEKLKGLSPLEKLGQGYSYTADVHGRKITQTGQVKKGTRSVCMYRRTGLYMKVTELFKDKAVDAGEVQRWANRQKSTEKKEEKNGHWKKHKSGV